MKTILAAAAMCAGAAGANVCTWIGGDGAWETASNWQDGNIPNAVGDEAVFPLAQNVAVTLGSQKTVGRIAVSGATLALSGSSLVLADSSGVAVIDVGEGAVFTNRCVVKTSSSNASSVAKTGGGDWFQGGYMNATRLVNGLDIRAGTFNTTFGRDSDGLKCCGSIKIRSGAKMKTWLSNHVENNTVYTIEEGGVLDGNGYSDAIGAIEGGGVITNATFSLNALTARSYVFSGRMYGGNVEYSVPADASCGLTIANPDAFANVALKVASSLAATEDLPIFKVADGLERYSLKYIYIATNPYCRVYIPLETVSGRPVEATMDFRHQAGSKYQGTMTQTRVRGSGTLVRSGYAYTITNGLVRGGATIIDLKSPNDGHAGEVVIGNGTSGKDPDMSEIGSLGVSTDVTLQFKNTDARDITNTVFSAGGTVQVASGTDWRFRDLNMTGGVFSVGAAGITNVTIDGGVSTGISFTQGNDAMDLVVNGGVFWATNAAFWGYGARTLHQTGGITAFGPITAYGDSFSSKANQETYIYMTGGKLYSWTYYNYSRGIGADLSGDAEMHLSVGKDTFQPHRLGSDSRAHTIRLRDNALLDVDRLDLSCSDTASRLVLDGGEFSVRSDIYSTSTGPKIEFGGGLVTSARDSGATWNLNGRVTGLVGAGGMKVHVPRTFPSSGLAWNNFTITSGVDGGVDGGLEKTGNGYLTFNTAASYTGPTVVRGGYLCSSAAAAAPFGTGDVVIDNARIVQPSSVATVQTLASADGAALSFAGGAVLSADNVSGSAGWTIGADGAAAPTLRRIGRGILALETSSNGKKAGVDAGFKVSGAEADAATGLVALPVFGYDSTISANQFGVTELWRVLRFMSVDAAGNLSPAATVNGVVDGAGNVCCVSSEKATVSANTHIGALDLSYEAGTTTSDSTCLNGLTISSGVTLTVGNGAGTLGVVLMNSMPSLYCNRVNQSFQSIQGGTLSFGAAEGLIACNQTFVYYSQETEPARVSSVISGTGGLTLASPYRAQGYPRTIRLSGANTYTGGTWIEGVMAQPCSASAFGAGTEVYVEGGENDGGGVEFIPESPATFGYNLHLSGRGVFWYDDMSRRRLFSQGAIYARRDVTISGAVAITNTVRVAAKRGCTLVFSTPITGHGSLETGGGGTVRLSAANSYSGGTVVTEGVLEVDDAGTFGAGDVEVKKDAELKFVNAQPKTVANRIFGEGRITFAAAGVTLQNADDFAGVYDGALASAAADGVVEVDASDGYNAASAQSGAFGVVKTGAGEMSLTGANAYTGGTAVEEGTLVLGRPAIPAAAPFADELLLRFDSSATNTMTLVEANGTNYVSAWSDADGRGVTLNSASAATRPILATNAINGLSTVWFAGNLIQRLYYTAAAMDVGSVFIVARTANNGSWHPNGKGWSCIGIIGTHNQDIGIRVSNKSLQSDGWMREGLYRVDGSEGATIPFERAFVATCRTTTRVYTGGISIGDYWANTTHKRGWYGDIAEVLLYKRRLADEEVPLVEAYLQAKWTPGAIPETPETAADVLPSGGDLTVAEGASVDLFGTAETVGSLDCAGEIVNTSAQKATLVVTEDSTLGGSIGENVVLRVTGGTLTILPGATLPPDITIYLAPGATIDLSGQTFDIRRIYRNGNVVNGRFNQSDPVRGFSLIIK